MAKKIIQLSTTKAKYEKIAKKMANKNKSKMKFENMIKNNRTLFSTLQRSFFLPISYILRALPTPETKQP
jgi:hypothetical protein